MSGKKRHQANDLDFIYYPLRLALAGILVLLTTFIILPLFFDHLITSKDYGVYRPIIEAVVPLYESITKYLGMVGIITCALSGLWFYAMLRRPDRNENNIIHLAARWIASILRG
tara:strand:+ start:5080 stop:5421 length:342 start_codon:yes stop_codon:yes gene_type:complete